MITECIENDITKRKSIFSRQIRNAPKKNKKHKDLENDLNTQASANRSTYLKTVLRDQVFNYNRDKILKNDGQLHRIQELQR